MNIVLYVLLFIIGAILGSLYGMLIFRIYNRVNIIHTQAYCERCGHKLKFYEKIPIFSYIFLGGKCKECKNKIDKNYLILELGSAILFVLMALCMKINVDSIKTTVFIEFLFKVLYFSGIIVISGIDMKYKKIEKRVLYYLIILSMIYICWLYFASIQVFYVYIIYLMALIILLIIDTFIQRKKAEESYLIGFLTLIIIMLINTNIFITFESIIVVFLAIEIVKLFLIMKNKLNKSKKNLNIKGIFYKVGYLVSIMNIILYLEYLIMK